MLPIGSTAR